MYALIENNVITKYPYSISELKLDNPDTSFPSELSNELLSEWNIYPITISSQPSITYKQNIVEGTPNLINGVWKQVWTVQDKHLNEVNAIQEEGKKQAYREESDPLFFKWQRGEATQQDWLDKVNEIKQLWI
jgi:hypothetical protein